MKPEQLSTTTIEQFLKETHFPDFSNLFHRQLSLTSGISFEQLDIVI